MPESKIGIMIACPNLGKIQTELVIRFLQWSSNPKYRVKIWLPQHLVPLDYARNVIRKEFLESDFEFLMMVDSDIVPPVGTIELADLQLDIVSPVCYVFKEEGIIPMALERGPDGWKVVGDLDRNQLVNVDCAGAGCLMIARRVLEKVPLFRFQYDDDGMLFTDEGFAWSDQCKKMGFDIFVYTNLVCQHFKTVDLSKLVVLQNQARKMDHSQSGSPMK